MKLLELLPMIMHIQTIEPRQGFMLRSKHHTPKTLLSPGGVLHQRLLFPIREIILRI